MNRCTSFLAARSVVLALGTLSLMVMRLAVAASPLPATDEVPQGAPNIVIILLDDIGFGDTSTFGGLAQTPELNKLAAHGLRYNNFHTTGTCSPTRAALLSGRNHHRVGFGFVPEWSGDGYPGYNGLWKKSTVAIPEVLRRNGYLTAAFGKWHNTQDREVSPIGPFERWPTGLGFDYFYGFLGIGMENHWEPAKLYRNTTPVEAPASPQQGYHLTSDLTDEAIRWLQTRGSLASDKPYFLYFATGAVHDPHHVPQVWIDRYRGRFDRGWDVLREQLFGQQKRLGVVPANTRLTPRPKEIPAWDSLTADQKRLFARQMEVYAGFIAHTDYEIGRLLRTVQQGPGADNTLILYIVGDNGASMQGGINGFADRAFAVDAQLNLIDRLGGPEVMTTLNAAGWGWLGNTPFKWGKGIASHFGGVRNPLVVSWPARIKDSNVRSQFTHVNDVAATLYEVAGVPFPSVVEGVKQQPLDGVSFAQSFDDPEARTRQRTQYFEMLGNRAIYQDGWVAAARHGMPWELFNRDDDPRLDRWELYHVDKDFSQSQDLAARYPQKLKTFQELFDREARANDVYPLGGYAGGQAPSSLTAGKDKFVYYPSIGRLPWAAMPPLLGKSYRVSAEVVIPQAGAQGVILSYGQREVGFALYVQNNRLIYENSMNHTHQVVASDTTVPRGRSVLGVEFLRDGVAAPSGTIRLLIDENPVGEGRVTEPVGYPYSFSMGVGRAFGSPVSAAFYPPFEFSGTLEKLTVELK